MAQNTTSQERGSVCVCLFCLLFKAASHGGSTLPTDLSFHLFLFFYISLFHTGGAYDTAQAWGSKGILRESFLLSTCAPGV